VGAQTVARAIAFTRAFAASAGLADTAADRLTLVVEEWVANIVEHGRAPAGSLVVLRLERSGPGALLTISDAGIAFDPRSVADTGPNLERGGGAGIALICGWSEIEDYRRRSGRNRLVLRSKS
jgi:serine/threonine-protein kinase RsbW